MDKVVYCTGIDVSKKKLDIALLRDGKIKPKAIANTTKGFQQLHDWFIFQKVDVADLWICLEATGPYSEALAVWLDDHGYRVSVVNPARVKGYAQSEMVRNKTDKNDAAVIARFCQAVKPERWHAPSAEIRALRALVDRLDELKQTRQQELNRVEAYEAQAQSSLIKNVQLHIEWLTNQIKLLESDIDNHIDGHPDLKKNAELMRSIPGMGQISVPKVMAYIGDIGRFKQAKSLAAYAGLTPHNRQSGTSLKGRAFLSRMGHSQLRTALYMPGLVARRHNPVLKEFADTLSQRGLGKKAVVCAVMRKLAHIIYGVLKSQTPFDANLLPKKLEIQDGI